jgi:hypothetical protein
MEKPANPAWDHSRIERQLARVEASKCDECGKSCGNEYNLAVHQGSTGHKQRAKKAPETVGAAP